MKPIEPMEALLAEALPDEAGWQYEPKWDGFRCVAMRDGDDVLLWSKSGKPLGRYFPEIVVMLGRLKAKRFVIDGELLVSSDGAVAFDALQQRLHPAESRIRKLAAATPAMFMAFDCLAVGDTMLGDEPLETRRKMLEKLVGGEPEPMLLLSPATADRDTALGWLERGGGALDGVIAKRLADPYQPGKRAMLKRKYEFGSRGLVSAMYSAQLLKPSPSKSPNAPLSPVALKASRPLARSQVSGKPSPSESSVVST